MSTLLHVVGTCVDDDGVKSVQVKLDDRDPAAAEGAEFWAWEMSVEGLTEGVHTLTVHGVDVNGLEGPAQTVRFNVDKKAPTTRIISLANGAIVSGKVTLEGEVADRERRGLPRGERRRGEGVRAPQAEPRQAGREGHLPLRPRHQGHPGRGADPVVQGRGPHRLDRGGPRSSCS